MLLFKGEKAAKLAEAARLIQLKSTALCKNVIRGVENAGFLDGFQVPIAHRVTYRYYMGVLSFLQEEYDKAEDHLYFAFNNCHRNKQQNRNLIMNYLVPLRLLKGKQPIPGLLSQFSQLSELYQTFITGCREVCLCNFVKLIHRLKLRSHQIPLDCFRTIAYEVEEDVDVDSKLEEVECLLANLISQIRLNALVLLRTVPLHPTNKIWSHLLTQEQQRQILNQLFNALLSQPTSLHPPEIINQFAHVIAHLTKNSPEITLKSSESIVLASLSSDHFPLRLAALQAICVPTLDLDTDFTNPVLQAILLPLISHSNQSQVETALTHLIEFVTFNDVSDLTTWFQPLLQLSLDQNLITSTRSTALECLITLIESQSPSSNSTPSLNWLNPVFHALLTLMAEIDEDEHWSLALDEDDDDDQDAIYVQAEQALDRLTQEVAKSHSDQLFELILSAVQQPLPDSWKAKHALLSVLAATGEGLAESFSNATEHIYHVLQSGFDDAHPRVVYAAIYAIAQLSSPLKISFSTKPVHQQVLSWLLRCLENSSQPRLQAFSAKALINVLWDDGFRKVEVADEMIGPILARLFSLCESNYTDRRSLSNKIRLDALNAIGRLFASVSQQGALAFYDTSISTLRKLVEEVELARTAARSDGSGVNEEEIDETELKIFEAISRLAMTTGEQRFNADADLWAKLMVNALERRPQGQMRILSSLAGLSGGMNAERFVNEGFLAILIDRLVKVCQSQPDISVSALFDEAHEFDDRHWESVVIGEQTYGIKSTELADKELSIKTLILLANNIGAWLIPHCDQIVAAVIPLLNFSDEVRESVMTLLPLLVQSAKASGMSAQQVEGVSTSFCNSITLTFSVEPLNSSNLADSLLMTWAECVGHQAPAEEETALYGDLACLEDLGGDPSRVDVEPS
ncbi:hypothetical protein VP01_292g13 [Puccinia sorghi]|uniref:Uncharacterized protein n=1 Tax=Puccinia sorghi TaxID=27349 RepID=A0A0L6V199_9BASI|nr:hypothetical protein VP01_292g13 [Puccinia sorghi]